MLANETASILLQTWNSLVNEKKKDVKDLKNNMVELNHIFDLIMTLTMSPNSELLSKKIFDALKGFILQVQLIS